MLINQEVANFTRLAAVGRVYPIKKSYTKCLKTERSEQEIWLLNLTLRHKKSLSIKDGLC